MYKPVRGIEVRVWGKMVGAVALDPKLGYYAFEYEPKFIDSGIELAPLTMPLSAAHQPFLFSDLPEATYRRLPALLADALPDDFGNSLIDSWMADQGIDKSRITPLDRLAYMGKRAMGALEFKPARGPTKSSSTAIKLSQLIDSARSVLQGDIGNDQLAKAALAQIIQVGTSAGGARAKREISVAAKLGCAVEHARLAAHQQRVDSVRFDRRKDSEYRVRDQASLQVRGNIARVSGIHASARAV